MEEIRTFLGTVQFYRRFVPRVALLAAPMTEKLKKNADLSDWTSVRRRCVASAYVRCVDLFY